MASTDTGFGKVRFFDDFLVDTINLDAYIVNADTGGTAFAVNEQENGVIRGTDDGTDGDITNIFGAEIWQPNVQGTLVFEVRLAKITSIATGIFIGFTDDNDTDEMPIDLDGGTLTTTATDAVGFCFDSGKDTANIYMVSVKNGTDGDLTDTGKDMELTTFHTYRVVVESNGNALFFIDGKQVGSRTACVTTTVQLAPCVAMLANGTASSTDIDYFFVEGGRA